MVPKTKICYHGAQANFCHPFDNVFDHSRQFYEKNDYKENVFVSFSLDWLTDGKDKFTKSKK